MSVNVYAEFYHRVFLAARMGRDLDPEQSALLLQRELAFSDALRRAEQIPFLAYHLWDQNFLPSQVFALL